MYYSFNVTSALFTKEILPQRGWDDDEIHALARSVRSKASFIRRPAGIAPFAPSRELRPSEVRLVTSMDPRQK